MKRGEGGQKEKKRKKIKRERKREKNEKRIRHDIRSQSITESRGGEGRGGDRPKDWFPPKRFVKKESRGRARVCWLVRVPALRMSLVTPLGDPGIRSHHTGLSTPTTVRTGLHYAFSNDPGCTTLSQIIVTRSDSTRLPLRFITCCRGNGRICCGGIVSCTLEAGGGWRGGRA